MSWVAVVDDDASIRQLLTQVLQDAHLRVRAFEDGAFWVSAPPARFGQVLRGDRRFMKQRRSVAPFPESTVPVMAQAALTQVRVGVVHANGFRLMENPHHRMRM